jgi:hypothetical protein
LSTLWFAGRPRLCITATQWGSLLEVVIFLLGSVAFGSKTQAAYREPCKAKYESSVGWSPYYDVQCIYVTGGELAVSTGSLRFDILKTYVVIFWAQDQASVIEIKDFVICGSEAKDRCADAIFGKVHGPDQEGRHWEVCQEGHIC